MSLVDYATSDDDEEEEHHHHYHASTQLEPQPQPQPQPQQQPQKSLRVPSRELVASRSSHMEWSKRSSGDPPSQNVSPVLPPPFEKLPDASLLLSSPVLSQPVGTDHSARVAAAMAENASRKREANGSSSSSIRGKIPRSQLPHSKNIPETSSGLLTPPQLRGRSNVVTEDISKLFVRRNSNSKEKS